MSRPPGEPTTHVTFNAWADDFEFLKSKHPAGGHLTFLRDLLHAWVVKMKEPEPEPPTQALAVSDEAGETLNYPRRRYP